MGGWVDGWMDGWMDDTVGGKGKASSQSQFAWLGLLWRADSHGSGAKSICQTNLTNLTNLTCGYIKKLQLWLGMEPAERLEMTLMYLFSSRV